MAQPADPVHASGSNPNLKNEGKQFSTRANVLSIGICLRKDLFDTDLRHKRMITN